MCKHGSIKKKLDIFFKMRYFVKVKLIKVVNPHWIIVQVETKY